jgi:hypothetical protein
VGPGPVREYYYYLKILLITKKTNNEEVTADHRPFPLRPQIPALKKKKKE